MCQRRPDNKPRAGRAVAGARGQPPPARKTGAARKHRAGDHMTPGTETASAVDQGAGRGGKASALAPNHSAPHRVTAWIWPAMARIRWRLARPPRHHRRRCDPRTGGPVALMRSQKSVAHSPAVRFWRENLVAHGRRRRCWLSTARRVRRDCAEIGSWRRLVSRNLRVVSRFASGESSFASLRSSKSLNLASSTDSVVISVLSRAICRGNDAAMLLRRDGLVTTGARGGLIRHPAGLVLADAEATCLRAASQLGLDPTSREHVRSPAGDVPITYRRMDDGV